MAGAMCRVARSRPAYEWTQMSQDFNLSKDDRQLLHQILAEWVTDNHSCTRNDVEADDIARAIRLRDRFFRSCPWLGTNG